MKIDILRKIVKIVTSQKNYLDWLQEGSFKLTSVQYSIENELYRIDFDKFNETMYSILVFEKESKKSVSLYFDNNSLSASAISYRKFIFFTKKSSYGYVIKEENYDNDSNIGFVRKVIPEYLINLR